MMYDYFIVERNPYLFLTGSTARCSSMVDGALNWCIHLFVSSRLYTNIPFIGYTANASAIRLGSPGSSMAASALYTRSILAEASPRPGPEAPLDPYARDPALVATVAFFLVGKISRVIILV